MSVILAIESSTARGSLALWRDGAVAEVRGFESGRHSNRVVFEPLGELLAAAPAIDLVVAGTGPGSYTGIRTGIAAALGVSLARGVPMIGVPSICAFREASGLQRYGVTGDARRGAWWFADIRDGRLAAAPEVDGPDAIAARAAAAEGVALFTPDAVSPPFCAAAAAVPGAEVLAARAAALPADECARLAAVPTEPLYLRAPFVTVPRKNAFAGPNAG